MSNFLGPMEWFPGAAPSFFIKRVRINQGVGARVTSVSGGGIETDGASVVGTLYQSVSLLLAEDT